MAYEVLRVNGIGWAPVFVGTKLECEAYFSDNYVIPHEAKLSMYKIQAQDNELFGEGLYGVP